MVTVTLKMRSTNGNNILHDYIRKTNKYSIYNLKNFINKFLPLRKFSVLEGQQAS